jgi:CHAD domain-containing protein
MESENNQIIVIKPVLTGYISESLSLLKQAPVPGDDVIHDVRVLMKKSRASLKLVRPQLDKGSFDRCNVALREEGRIMCSWREASVHRKIFKKLKKEFPSIFGRLSGNNKVIEILEKNGPINFESEDVDVRLANIEKLLRNTGFRIRFQTWSKLNPEVLITEIENSYNSVKDIYLVCRNYPKPDNIHEFRKKAKDLLYQLYFFRDNKLSKIRQFEKKLDIIARNLGKYNDLTQLIKELRYKYQRDSNDPALDELVVKIREKQDECLVGVWPVAYHIFYEIPLILNKSKL